MTEKLNNKWFPEGNASQLWLCQLLSHVRLFATPWTAARQAPLSVGFSRHEYWSGLPFLFPGDPPDSGIELQVYSSSSFFFLTILSHREANCGWFIQYFKRDLQATHTECPMGLGFEASAL